MCLLVMYRIFNVSITYENVEISTYELSHLKHYIQWSRYAVQCTIQLHLARLIVQIVKIRHIIFFWEHLIIVASRYTLIFQNL